MKRSKAPSKREQKKAMAEMKEELLHILNTTDYSNYEIKIFYDEMHHQMIIPKPVFALSCVDDELREQLITEINRHPACNVVIS